MSTKQLRIAIDFDGTLCDVMPHDDNWPMGPVKEGAKDLLKAWTKAGHYLIIHTARISGRPTDDRQFDAIRDYLDSQDVPFDLIWDESGKPIADIYIDDRAIRFTNWPMVAHQVQREVIKRELV